MSHWFSFVCIRVFRQFLWRSEEVVEVHVTLAAVRPRDLKLGRPHWQDQTKPNNLTAELAPASRWTFNFTHFTYGTRWAAHFPLKPEMVSSDVREVWVLEYCCGWWVRVAKVSFLTSISILNYKTYVLRLTQKLKWDAHGLWTKLLAFSIQIDHIYLSLATSICAKECSSPVRWLLLPS